MANLHGKPTWPTWLNEYILDSFFRFNLVDLQCNKKNLTFVDCCDKIFIKLILKNVIKLAKGSPNNIFQNSFYKISSQQLTHDRPYM